MGTAGADRGPRGDAPGEFEVFVCYDPDRFSRKQTHAGILLDICERAGVELRFAMFDFTKDATGQFLLNARVFAAEMEREKLIERSMRGKRACVESGKIMPASRPLYSYQFSADRTAYEVDPATAPVVRRIFAEYLTGRSLRQIAAGLTADPVPSPTGKDFWGLTTVRDILTDPRYAGEARGWRYAATREPGGKRRNRVRPPEEQIALPDGTIPAIVDAATYRTAQARLATANARTCGRPPRDPEAALLRRYAACGYCGILATIHWQTRNCVMCGR